ncbi:hypothetical protein V8C42DRAFT_279995 [Trichoderma barbatum]
MMGSQSWQCQGIVISLHLPLFFFSFLSFSSSFLLFSFFSSFSLRSVCFSSHGGFPTCLKFGWNQDCSLRKGVFNKPVLGEAWESFGQAKLRRGETSRLISPSQGRMYEFDELMLQRGKCFMKVPLCLFI